MNKKICLIIPPSSFLLDERVFAFLGILKVAAAFEAQGRTVEVLDLSGIDNYLDVVADYFGLNKELELVGLTATTPQMPNCFEIATKVREIQPGCKLVIGGSHVTLMHSAAKLETKNGFPNERSNKEIDRIKSIFDVLVCGDGELTLGEILKMDKGVIDVDDRFSPMFLTNQSFSESPFPARHLIDLDTYHYTIENHKSTSLIGQLGCPYRCSFCSGRNSPYLRVIRNRSVQSIVDEVRLLYTTYGFTGYMFYDDELNVSKSMIQLMNSLADLQNELGVEFRLRGFVKSELFNEAQAEAMYRAGFRWLLCGFESGDERILKNIEKQATRDDNTRAVEVARKHGLKIKALMSCGHAGEKHETIQHTEDWLLEVQPDDFDLTVITSFPGSPYYDSAVPIGNNIYLYTQPKTGDKLYQVALDYTKDAGYYKGRPSEYVSYVYTDFISAEELVRMRDQVENNVRAKLNIPFNAGKPASKYEHSMSQGNVFPDWILRSSEKFKQTQKKSPLKLNVLK